MGELIIRSAEEMISSVEHIHWQCPDLDIGDTVEVYAYGHGPIVARVTGVYPRPPHIRPFNRRWLDPNMYEVVYGSPSGVYVHDYINKNGDEFWRFPETLRTIPVAKPKGAYCSLKKPGCVVWNEYAEEKDGKYHCYMCRGHYA